MKIKQNEKLPRRINAAGLALIKQFEGLRTEAYICPAGVLSIGYGHTKGVQKGDVCTEAEAEVFLLEDLEDASIAVTELVTVPLNENQFSALVSFVFNVGRTNFKESTLLTLLNVGRYGSAARQFGRWVFANKKRLAGLAARRKAEEDLFNQTC